VLTDDLVHEDTDGVHSVDQRIGIEVIDGVIVLGIPNIISGTHHGDGFGGGILYDAHLSHIPFDQLTQFILGVDGDVVDVSDTSESVTRDQHDPNTLREDLIVREHHVSPFRETMLNLRECGISRYALQFHLDQFGFSTENTRLGLG